MSAFIYINFFMIVSDWEFADAIRLDLIANIVGLVWILVEIQGFFLILSKIALIAIKHFIWEKRPT